MQFSLFPWDRNRPRRNSSLADCIVEHNGKTFGLRAQNGILFFRDAGDLGKTWAIATPLPSEIESDETKFESFWRREFECGNVARVVVPLVMLHLFNKRPIPLFLKGDGTGFARESWNRDDIAFSHRVSLHEWLEGADETVMAGLQNVEDELENKLSGIPFPHDTSFEEPEIEWACGSQEELQEIIAWACALETALWGSQTVTRVEVEIGAENAFARAHLHGLRWMNGRNQPQERTQFETRQNTDEPTVVVEHIYETSSEGWQTMTNQTKTPFLPSGRFWRLLDVALDANTPMGLYWQYTDQGSGRCADSPEAPTVSFSVTRPSPQKIEAAREHLRAYLQGAVPRAEVQDILSDDAPRDLPEHEWGI